MSSPFECPCIEPIFVLFLGSAFATMTHRHSRPLPPISSLMESLHFLSSPVIDILKQAKSKAAHVSRFRHMLKISKWYKIIHSPPVQRASYAACSFGAYPACIRTSVGEQATVTQLCINNLFDPFGGPACQGLQEITSARGQWQGSGRGIHLQNTSTGHG